MIFLGVPAIGDIGIDAVISETTTQDAVVTSNPVEFGADVSDHIYLKPKTYMLNGVVSDLVLGPIETTPGGDVFDGGESRSKTAWEILQEIEAQGSKFTLQTNLERVTDMVIVSLKTTQDKSSSKALFFECMLQKVLLAESELVELTSAQLQESAKNNVSTSEQGRKQKEPRESFFSQIRTQLGEVIK